ncbi:unnamed protein product [Paramecium sonneborni]|uniref:Uncharacterized protein n=1 Tax=Paramecium sonneborni TaxID=65129 RepID=A0A8S1MM45_9CILI|nr:unnamed protein product [Paramecium sonneborni]
MSHLQFSQDSCSSEESEIKIETSSSSYVSKKSKKIRNVEPKPPNYGYGRPGKESISQLSNEQRQFIEINMKEVWFCTNLSTKCLIYLCNKGNMILKVKTGKPAEHVKRKFLEVFGKPNLKFYKKYKKDFKKKLQEKHITILKHLGYSEKTTYLFLSNNNENQIDLKLEYFSDEARNGLASLIKYLSPQFIYTFKVIVECFDWSLANIQEEDSNIIDFIVEKLKTDKKNHQMIFNMQLIQELLYDDTKLLNQIENDPEQAYLYLKSNMTVTIPNFNSNSYKDQVESIEQYSKWINTFISEFVDILQQNQ